MTEPLHKLTVTQEDEGIRLDRFLQKHFPEYSRSFLQRGIKQGKVLVDGKTTKTGLNLEPGQVVTLPQPKVEPVDLKPVDLPLTVIFEDKHILVLNKAPGMTVHPANNEKQDTLVNALLFHYPELDGVAAEQRPGIVHRLDRNTSGVMVVARTPQAHAHLAAQFQNRTVSKQYRALVYGVVNFDEGEVNEPLGRNPKQRERSMIREDGREALTVYKTLERFQAASHVACFPKTGRTHQIRVHMQHLGHALIGDDQYPQKQLPKGFPSNLKAARCMLHAHKLGFAHPQSEAQVTFEADLPEDFMTVLQNLGSEA